MNIYTTLNTPCLASYQKVENFPEKNLFIDLQGKTVETPAVPSYKILEKYERSTSVMQRIGKIVLGVILAIATLGMVLISNKIRSLFKNEIHSLFLAEKLNEEIPKQIPPTINSNIPAVKAILYTSLSANPIHKGHMGIIATAIDGLRKQNINVEKAFVALSFESYIKNKVQRDNAKIISENINLQDKKPLKVLLKRETRVKFLEAAIAESQDQLQGVPVQYWNDQDKGSADHPEAYERLAQENPDHRVFLIAGTDLCNSMGNWGGKKGIVKHAVIISRQNVQPTIKSASSKSYSRIILEGSNEFQDYSSTAIQQQLKVEYLPKSVQQEFLQLHSAAQSLT